MEHVFKVSFARRYCKTLNDQILKTTYGVLEFTLKIIIINCDWYFRKFYSIKLRRNDFDWKKWTYYLK